MDFINTTLLFNCLVAILSSNANGAGPFWFHRSGTNFCLIGSASDQESPLHWSSCNENTYWMQDDPNQQGHIKWQNQPNVCMDGEHCHHGSSNDRLSDCNHCGAVHWQYNGGRLCEDDCKNCICDDGSQTTIHYCSDCAIHFDRVQLEM